MNIRKIKKTISTLGLFMAAFTLMGIAAQAQSIDSTLALKEACELSANNTVTISYPAKISNGARPPQAEVVNTPCTIVLAPSGSFETDQIAMRFNGPFVIQSSSPTQVKFVKSFFSAPAMTLNARGTGSFVGVDESLLQTDAGDLAINTGADGVLEILLPLSGSQSSLDARGNISLNGGAKFTTSLLDTQLSAGGGINVFMAGTEGVFKTEKSNLVANGGAISVRSNSSKGLVEGSFGDWRAANGVVVALPLSESSLVLNNVRVFGGTGNINFNISPNGNTGKAEITDSALDTNGAVNVLSSVNAQYGMSKLQTSTVRSGGATAIRTGSLGETLVITSRLNSPVAIRLTTGLGGNCLSDQNALTSPVVQACR